MNSDELAISAHHISDELRLKGLISADDLVIAEAVLRREIAKIIASRNRNIRAGRALIRRLLAAAPDFTGYDRVPSGFETTRRAQLWAGMGAKKELHS